MKRVHLNRVLRSLAFLTFATVVIGHGCSEFKGNSDGSSSSATSLLSSELEIIPKEDTKTVSLVYSNQVLDNFVSCTGIGKASDRTISVYNEKKGAISEFGIVTSLTAPMMMAVMGIAGEVCTDLIDSEAMSSSPRIFVGFDFTSSSIPSSSLISDSARRLARSCWQRNENSTELKTLLDGINAALSSSSSTGKTRKAALLLCTSILSSLEGLTL